MFSSRLSPYASIRALVLGCVCRHTPALILLIMYVHCVSRLFPVGGFRAKAGLAARARKIYRLNYLVLDPLGGLDRHILPPLSPSQPVIAEKKIGCWGKEPSRSSLRKLVAAGEITNIFVLEALGWCFPGISEFRQLRSGLGSSAPHRPGLHRSTIARSNAAPYSALRCPAALA